jgi:MOSC domain-containing protein YiiM
VTTESREADYTHDDLLGTLRALPPIWRLISDGVEPATLAARPAPDGSSAIEQLRHSWVTTEATRHAMSRSLTEQEPVIVVPEPAARDTDDAVEFADGVLELEASVARLIATAGAMTESDWARRLTLGDDGIDIEVLVARAVRDTTNRLHDVGRGLHSLGAGAPRQHGALVQVSSSNGGVPKTALPSATIGRGGVSGDRQNDRLHHGRPLQAVCLWSQDVIDALRAEGHPVYAGAAGENLTVSGIDWATIRPGVRLSVGAALLEISAFATPCAKNGQWFRDGKFRRIDQNAHPGWSRAYAWVLEGGAVAPGDSVVVEP